jgi:hypothetical protein
LQPRRVLDGRNRLKSYFPVVLAIGNSSPSGIRNLYIELDISATSDSVEVAESKSALIGQDFELAIFRMWATERKALSSIFKRDDKIFKRVQRAPRIQ